MLLEEYDEEYQMGLFRKDGIAEGLEEGRKEGRAEACASLVRDGLISLRDAAAHAGIPESQLLELVDSRR